MLKACKIYVLSTFIAPHKVELEVEMKGTKTSKSQRNPLRKYVMLLGVSIVKL
jgi:hypothetical protein